MNKLQAKGVLAGAINAMLINLNDMAQLEGTRADFGRCIALHTQALDRALDDVFDGGEELTVLIDEGASDYGRRRIFGCKLFSLTAWTDQEGRTGFSVIEKGGEQGSPNLRATARIEFNDGSEAQACRRLFGLRPRSGDLQHAFMSDRPLGEGDYGVMAGWLHIENVKEIAEDEFKVDFRTPEPIDNFNEPHHTITDDAHTAIIEAPATGVRRDPVIAELGETLELMGKTITDPVQRRHNELRDLLNEILIELQLVNRRNA